MKCKNIGTTHRGSDFLSENPDKLIPPRSRYASERIREQVIHYSSRIRKLSINAARVLFTRMVYCMSNGSRTCSKNGYQYRMGELSSVVTVVAQRCQNYEHYQQNVQPKKRGCSTHLVGYIAASIYRCSRSFSWDRTKVNCLSKQTHHRLSDSARVVRCVRPLRTTSVCNVRVGKDVDARSASAVLLIGHDSAVPCGSRSSEFPDRQCDDEYRKQLGIKERTIGRELRRFTAVHQALKYNRVSGFSFVQSTISRNVRE